MTDTPTYHPGIAGIGHFDALPRKWRLAEESDFYHEGALLIDVPYLIRNHAGEYETYRTKARSIHNNIKDILTFISLKRVYVLE